MHKKLMTLLVLCLLANGCLNKKANDQELKEQLKTTLNAHPEIFIDFLKNNKQTVIPLIFELIDSVNEEKLLSKKEEMEALFKKYYLNPLSPDLSTCTEPLGEDNAPHTIVMFQDFTQPFSMRGYYNVDKLMESRKDIKLYIKHLVNPQDNTSFIAASYFEALAQLDPEKAWDFRDDIFERFWAFKDDGVRLLTVAVTKQNVEFNKVIQLAASDQVKQRIQSHTKEALDLGVSRTPAYIIDGVLIQGDYPSKFLEFILEQAKKKRKEAKINSADK